MLNLVGVDPVGISESTVVEVATLWSPSNRKESAVFKFLRCASPCVTGKPVSCSSVFRNVTRLSVATLKLQKAE
jgi:hypothetical protein